MIDGSPRVEGLDGLRGLAALYVAVFHCWLVSFPGFPANSGPWWLGLLMYGRLAVVFFLVLSGFSLAISPARNGWRLGSIADFARRRAWRILPPYWAALVFSLLVASQIVAASHFGPPTAKTDLVYGLMLQDLLTAPTPNGAFWSIAVEAELYIVFPILILLRRRTGPLWTLLVVLAPVVGFGLASPGHTPVEGANHLAPNLAPVFVAGILAAGLIRRLPWAWLAVLAGAPVAIVVITHGSVWTVNHYFWIDLAVVPSMVFLVLAVATGFGRRMLTLSPMRALGTSSYSLYLTHLPIVMIVSRKLAVPHFGQGLTAFGVTLALGIPASVLFSRAFAAVFELPFQRHRSLTALRR